MKDSTSSPTVIFALPQPVMSRVYSFPSLQLPAHDPLVAQLHEGVQATLLGLISQTTSDLLFVTSKVPPSITLLALDVPEILISLNVFVVKSNNTFPEGAVKYLLIPSFEKVKPLPVFVMVCPETPDFSTDKEASLLPVIVKLGSLTTLCPLESLQVPVSE